MTQKYDISEAFNLLNEAYESVSKKSLNEAVISPEDKRESDIIRGLYKKIDGKKLNPKNLSAEEKEIIDKYGIDAWGFRGDTKVVSPKGKDIVNNSEMVPDYWANRNKPSGKEINYADRIRKIDDRNYAQRIHKYWNGRNFQDRERNLNGQDMSQPYHNMKWELSRRNLANDTIANADKRYEDDVNNANKRYDDAVSKAKSNYDSDKAYHSKSLDIANGNIQNLLDKYRKGIKEALSKLREGTMSDADRKDNDTLIGIYNKLQGRKNAKLTSDEQSVMRKYGIIKDTRGDLRIDSTNNDTLQRIGREHYDDLSVFPHQSFDNQYRWDYKTRQPKKDFNFVDRIRKLPNREYAKKVNDWYYKDFNKSEKEAQSKEMGQDVSDMRGFLADRKYHSNKLNQAEKDRESAITKATLDRTKSIDNAQKRRVDSVANAKQQVADSNAKIKSMLNRKNESFDESQDRIVKSGLQNTSINRNILNSVIGQMSDGIWENTNGYNRYWVPVDIDDNCNIVVDPNSQVRYCGEYISNAYWKMSDDEVRKFFANKIKYIAQLSLHDNNQNPYKNWNAENTEVCPYLERENDVTYADAFKAYQIMK